MGKVWRERGSENHQSACICTVYFAFDIKRATVFQRAPAWISSNSTNTMIRDFGLTVLLIKGHF
jgi:hypothetical protein